MFAVVAAWDASKRALQVSSPPNADPAITDLLLTTTTTTTNATTRTLLSSSCPARALVAFLPFGTPENQRQPEPKPQFLTQLKWLLLSWREMRKHLNATCRVDIVIVSEQWHPSLQTIGCTQVMHDDDKSQQQQASTSTTTTRSHEDLSQCLILTGFKPATAVSYRNRFVGSIESIDYAFATFPKLLHSYDWILRSDLDVFLTPSFATWIPQRFSVGKGDFCFPPHDTCRRLRRIGIEQQWLSPPPTNTTQNASQGLWQDNVGSTWYGPAATIEKCANLSMRVAQHLDAHEFNATTRKSFGWPKWHYGVLSMYAGQIAIHGCTEEDGYDRRTDMLDVSSTSDRPIRANYAAHIHTWPLFRFFSKLKFFSGAYDDNNNNAVDIDALNRSLVSGYAGYMALASRNDSLFHRH